MREKLIEILLHDGCPDDGCDFCQYADSEHCRAETIADHIIANGVTIPVRCKDCKHWVKEIGSCSEHPTYYGHGMDWYIYDEEDFCSCGEKKP